MMTEQKFIGTCGGKKLSNDKQMG